MLGATHPSERCPEHKRKVVADSQIELHSGSAAGQGSSLATHYRCPERGCGYHKTILVSLPPRRS